MAGPFQKLKENKKAVAIAAIGVIAVAGGGMFFLKVSKKGAEHGADTHVAAEHGEEHAKAEHGEEHAKAEHGEEHAKAEHGEKRAPALAAVETHPASHGFFGRFWQAFENIQASVEQIRRLDLENQRLKLENAQLRLRLESNQFDSAVAQSRQLTEEFVARTQKSAGTRVGRTLASISYHPPTHLLPRQLHALGVSQFKSREYEKAAVIFTMLAEMSKEPAFQSNAHRMMTAITWYRLKNWEMSEAFFDQVLQSSDSGNPEKEELKNLAQARLWKALLAQQRGQKAQAQEWMSQLVEHHPRSPEARWINTHHEAGGHRVRVPASHH